MNLIDENVEKEELENKKKTLKIIIISIIALIVVAAIIIIYATIKNNNTLKLNYNGDKTDFKSELFLMNSDNKSLVEENGQIYISVKKMAAYLGVEYYNDEYKNKGEDTTKCYIKTSNEYTSYISNSSQIYKAIIREELVEDSEDNKTTTTKSREEYQKITEYEYFTKENSVKYINGEIYVSQEAAELGFNIDISYDSKSKTVTIYTLDGLETAVAKVVTNAVIGEDIEYTNKKLLKYGLVLIKNANDSYGIANYNNYQEGNYLVSCKYSNIKFCESSNTVIVTTADDELQGILKLDLNSNSAKVLIEPKYQSIKIFNDTGTQYVVKENGKYGIIDITGDVETTILKTQYQKIGIDGVNYEYMESKYIINDKYIPVKIDNKWGIVNLEGKTLISPQYADIGCNLGSGNGVIILPEFQDGIDGIVFCTDATIPEYTVINAQNGAKMIQLNASEIYSKYENNATKYYMKIAIANGGTMEVNIYDLFGKKVQTTDNVEDIENNTNQNTNNATNEITTTEKNNTNTENIVSNDAEKQEVQVNQ